MYDGDIILILEGAENFHDGDSKSESSPKFWLPKYFPERIRVILTASPKSKCKEYLKSLGCSIITLNPERKVFHRIIEECCRDPSKRLGGSAHVQKLKEIVQSQFENYDYNSILFIKGIFSLFSPRVQDLPPKKDRLSLSKVLAMVDYKKLVSRPLSPRITEY